MINLAPVSNAAAKALRDNALIGFGFIVVGVAWLAIADNRVFRAGAFLFLTLGFLTVLPSLIARGIQLERQSRGSP
jgi:hypothetical protein